MLGVLESEKEMVEITATYIDHMGSDLSVVNAARVSFAKTSEWVTSTVPTNGPPVFVARQLVKHKFLRWNEVSRRYVDDEPEFYVPDVWRGRSADKKQGSEGVVEGASHLLYEWDEIYGSMTYTDSNLVCLNAYNELLCQGVAPEQARMVLPQSMMTEWYWSGSLDAFASMCQLRCKPDTQYESQIVANQISEVMGKLFPVSWEALMDNSSASAE